MLSVDGVVKHIHSVMDDQVSLVDFLVLDIYLSLFEQNPTFSMEYVYLHILHMFLLMNYGRFKIQIVLTVLRSFAHFKHKNGGSLTFSNDPKVSSSCFWMSFLPSLILHQFWIAVWSSLNLVLKDVKKFKIA